MATAKQTLEYQVRLRDFTQKSLRMFGTNAKKAADKAKGAFAGVTRTLKKYALGLKVAGVAMAFFGARMGFRRVLEFSKAMGEVRTIMDETTVSFAEAEAQVRKLAIQLGNPAPAVAKGLYQTLSAGVTDSAEALVLMGQAGKLAVAGLATTKQSVDLLTTIINAYGETVTKEGIEKTSDMVFQMVRLGKLTIPETAAAFGRVIPQAAVLGVSLEEVSAAVGTLTLSGLSASEAVTQMTSLFTAFLRKAEVAKVLYPRLNNLMGMNAIRSKGLAKAMQDIADATGGSGDEIIKLMGRQEGMKALMALTGKQAGQFAKQLRMIGGASGETEEAFKKMMDTTERRFAVMKEAVVQGFEGMVKEVVEIVLDGEKDLDEFQKTAGGVKEGIEELAPLAAAGAAAGTAALAGLQSTVGLIRGISFDRLTSYIERDIEKVKDSMSGLRMEIMGLYALNDPQRSRDPFERWKDLVKIDKAKEALAEYGLELKRLNKELRAGELAEEARNVAVTASAAAAARAKLVTAELVQAAIGGQEETIAKYKKNLEEAIRLRDETQRAMDLRVWGEEDPKRLAKFFRLANETTRQHGSDINAAIDRVDKKLRENIEVLSDSRAAYEKFSQQPVPKVFSGIAEALGSVIDGTKTAGEAWGGFKGRVFAADTLAVLPLDFEQLKVPHATGEFGSKSAKQFALGFKDGLGGAMAQAGVIFLESLEEMAAWGKLIKFDFVAELPEEKDILGGLKRDSSVLVEAAERFGIELNDTQLTWKKMIDDGTILKEGIADATVNVGLMREMAGQISEQFDWGGILRGTHEQIKENVDLLLEMEKIRLKGMADGFAKERAMVAFRSKEALLGLAVEKSKALSLLRERLKEDNDLSQAQIDKTMAAKLKAADEVMAHNLKTQAAVDKRQLKDIEKKYAAFARLQGAALASTMGAAFKKLAGDFEITPKMNFELLKADFEAAQKELDDIISDIYGVPEEGATPLRAGMEGFLDPEQLAMVQLFLDRWKETTLASAEVAANARLVGTNLAESLGGALEFVSQYAEFEVTPKLELEILKEMLAQAEQELANKPITLEFTVEDRAQLEAMVEGIRSGYLLTLEWEASFTKLGTTLAESLDPSLANLTQYASFDVTPTLQLEQFRDGLEKLKAIFDQPISDKFSAEQKESLGALIFDLETVALKTLEADAALFNYLRTLEGLSPVVGGLKAGFAQFIDQIPELGDAIADVTSGALNSFVTGMTNAFSSFIDDSKSANEAWKDFAKEFLRQIAAMIVQMLILQAIKTLFPTVGAAAGGVAEGGVGELGTIAGQNSPIRRAEGGYIPGGLGSRTAIDWNPAMEFAKGGVVPDGLSAAIPMGLGRALPVRGYAMGGSIVKEPHMAVIGEGKMDEAIVPLPDGRSIPVEMRGGGETSISFTINAVDARGVDELLVERQDTIRSIIRQAMTEDRLFRNTMRGG